MSVLQVPKTIVADVISWLELFSYEDPKQENILPLVRRHPGNPPELLGMFVESR